MTSATLIRNLKDKNMIAINPELREPSLQKRHQPKKKVSSTYSRFLKHLTSMPENAPHVQIIQIVRRPSYYYCNASKSSRVELSPSSYLLGDSEFAKFIEHKMSLPNDGVARV